MSWKSHLFWVWGTTAVADIEDYLETKPREIGKMSMSFFSVRTIEDPIKTSIDEGSNEQNARSSLNFWHFLLNPPDHF